MNSELNSFRNQNYIYSKLENMDTLDYHKLQGQQSTTSVQSDFPIYVNLSYVPSVFSLQQISNWRKLASH